MVRKKWIPKGPPATVHSGPELPKPGDAAALKGEESFNQRRVVTEQESQLSLFDEEFAAHVPAPKATVPTPPVVNRKPRTPNPADKKPLPFAKWCKIAWTRLYQRYAFNDSGAMHHDDCDMWVEAWLDGENPRDFANDYAEDRLDLQPLDMWTVQDFENDEPPEKLRFQRSPKIPDRKPKPTKGY